ncbi:MAG TPA: tetratricopeptide repeat protein [Pyrinomonadaceae bacterium]|nr:tetratricopeptide repeat protein [Pyrinomonadaceae bacterium]
MVPFFVRLGNRRLTAWMSIGIFALIVRLIYLFGLRGTPLFAVVIGDAKEYTSWAERIAGGQWIGSEIFYQTPLYPYLLALVFKIIGHSLFGVRVVQAIVGATSCVLLGRAGERFFYRRVGIIAALLLAIYPPAIFFDGLIQKSALDLFLITLILVTLAEFPTKQLPRWLIIGGLVGGALMLNRENARVLYPIIVGWLFIYFRARPLKQRMTWALLFTVSVAAVLIPVALRNYYVGGEFVISTSQLGPNLYIGNHAGARGSYEPLVPDHGNAEFERTDAKQLADKASGKNLRPSEVSDYWVHRSLEYMRSQPGAWARLFGRKILLTFNAKEAVDTESIEAYEEYSPILRLLSWYNFGVIFPLAALGAWLTRKHWRGLAILYAIVLGMAVAVAIFYVVARYRYPIVPLVLLFAAVPISLVPKIRTLRRKEWLTGLFIVVCAAVFSNVPVRALGDETFLNIGQELIRTNRPAEAIPILRRAVAAAPSSAQCHYNLGLALRQSGMRDEALKEFSEAIRLRPNYFEAHAGLALTLKESGQLPAALEEFHEAVRLEPNNAAAHIGSADVLLALGRTSEAIPEYQQAANLAPDLLEAHYRLAQAYVRVGQLPEAVKSLQKALEIANAQGRKEEAQQIVAGINACRARMKQ